MCNTARAGLMQPLALRHSILSAQCWNKNVAFSKDLTQHCVIFYRIPDN
jgi:hypothetical protein